MGCRLEAKNVAIGAGVIGVLGLPLAYYYLAGKRRLFGMISSGSCIAFSATHLVASRYFAAKPLPIPPPSPRSEGPAQPTVGDGWDRLSLIRKLSGPPVKSGERRDRHSGLVFPYKVVPIQSLNLFASEVQGLFQAKRPGDIIAPRLKLRSFFAAALPNKGPTVVLQKPRTLPAPPSVSAICAAPRMQSEAVPIGAVHLPETAPLAPIAKKAPPPLPRFEFLCYRDGVLDEKDSSATVRLLNDLYLHTTYPNYEYWGHLRFEVVFLECDGTIAAHRKGEIAQGYIRYCDKSRKFFYCQDCQQWGTLGGEQLAIRHPKYPVKLTIDGKERRLEYDDAGAGVIFGSTTEIELNGSLKIVIKDNREEIDRLEWQLRLNSQVKRRQRN